MAQNTFFVPGQTSSVPGQQPSIAALTAALKGQQAPMMQQAPPPTSAPAPFDPSSVISDTPFATGYNNKLIDSGLKDQTTGSAWEGMGRLAQLTSGYYGNSKNDAKQAERDQSLAKQINDSDPKLGALYASSDAAGRAKISSDFISQHHEKVRDDRQLEKLKSFQDVDLSDPMAVKQAIIKSGDKDLYKTWLSQEMKKHEDKGALNKKVEMLTPIYGREKAIAIANGISPDQMPGNAPKEGSFKQLYANLHEDPNMTPANQKLAAEGEMKAHAKASAEIQTNAIGARRSLATLGNAEDAIKEAYQGPQAPLVNSLKMYANAAGLEVKGLTEAQILQSLSTDMARASRTGFPGSVSNFEMENYIKANPNAMNTPEGNKAIIAIMRRDAEGHIAVERDAQDYQKQKGGGMNGILGSGFQRYRADKANERTAARETQRADQAAAAANAPPPQTRTQKLDAKSQPAVGQFTTGMTGTNPETGKKIRFDGKTWVPVTDQIDAGVAVPNYDPLTGAQISP
jgi:hypothetical protein